MKKREQEYLERWHDLADAGEDPDLYFSVEELQKHLGMAPDGEINMKLTSKMLRCDCERCRLSKEHHKRENRKRK